ncbi:response regulator transcription factor [Actinoplanes sp. L3-i22]|uniref:response regulator transcription factor n=1 Tax=Actinoplanes sp. L3-i22 TaxID=2836373 RepID=UPI001C76B16A|nr:LuxR C-terminal-related transcriptional regulator [Actinoplanes sp. L3-i22]BCY05790.1 hypothetical protein L3i22_008780 [Actinoplanes sp. L3-i22]
MTDNKPSYSGTDAQDGRFLSLESQKPGRAADLTIEHWPISDPNRLVNAAVVLRNGAIADPLALIAAGARAVLADESELDAAGPAVAAGGSYLSPAVMARIRPGDAAEPVRLAPRQIAALRCIVAGLTHRAAAKELGVTEQTFNTYAKRLRRKLGVSNKAELTRRAAELGLIPM